MSSSVLDRDLADGVLTLTLNRPEQRNAIDPELRAALAARLDEAATDAEVRAVVVTGAQQTFCAALRWTEMASARYHELRDRYLTSDVAH